MINFVFLKRLTPISFIVQTISLFQANNLWLRRSRCQPGVYRVSQPSLLNGSHTPTPCGARGGDPVAQGFIKNIPGAPGVMKNYPQEPRHRYCNPKGGLVDAVDRRTNGRSRVPLHRIATDDGGVTVTSSRWRATKR